MSRPRLPALALLMLPALAAAQHAGHDHSQHQQHQQTAQETPASEQPQPRPEWLPEPTAADRAAAFPDLGGMDMSEHMDDDPLVWKFGLDHLEYREDDSVAWEITSWIGTDRHRMWIRGEGEFVRDEVDGGSIELLYGRPLTPWWDAVAGLREDYAGDRHRTWIGLGVQGLAPYKFESEATLYLRDGQAALEYLVEYELLLSQRWHLVPELEVTVLAGSDERWLEGPGLSEVVASLRLLYRINPQVAPYVGISWEGLFGETADRHRAAGEGTRDTQWLVGVSVWF